MRTTSSGVHRVLTMRTPLFILLLATTQLGATDCGGGITRDPGFDLWCGDTLCAWKIERGEVRRSATWHEADSGVELLADAAAIEQFTPVDSHDGTCIRFELVSDVAESAQVELEVDIYGDGSVERTYPLPTTHWKPTSYLFAVQPPFTGIRFAIAKHGPGRAVVARMRAAVVDTGCDGVTPLDGGPAPLGALCDTGADCASATCVTASFFSVPRCAGCDPAGAACPGGQTCGLDEPGPADRDVPVACIAASAGELGEQCLRPTECASGLCTAGVCSACAANQGCACAPAYPHGPSLCDPGLGHGVSGAACANDDDCASQHCSGAPRRQCSDGRSCATDANCPVDISLVPGPCTTVGVQGGRCD